MFSVLGFIIILIMRVKSDVEEELQNNNGWKPLTSDQILNLHGKLFATRTGHTTDTVNPAILHWNPSLPVEENFRHSLQDLEVKPHDINSEFIKNIDYIGKDDINSHVGVSDEGQHFISEYSSAIETKIHNPSVERRKHAKTILENQETSTVDISHIDKHYDDTGEPNMDNMPEKVIMKETIDINGKSNVYEVTEVSESPEIKDLLSIDQNQINERKPYFEPNLKAATEKDLSNTLLHILSNYNIRINDDLTNYALSRNKHNSHIHKQKYGYLAPLRTQPIRNSENFLPLDPLLAVFLSNYGFYLPGYYGFPGKYYNIYGYLASNNIHNNKPFGAYKIYSDTDSSH